MNGYGKFILIADYAYIAGGDRSFAVARQWCTESFGHTVELEIWSKYAELQNPKWSWERGDFNKSHRCRIYLADQLQGYQGHLSKSVQRIFVASLIYLLMVE
jgi:hypothetical protein